MTLIFLQGLPNKSSMTALRILMVFRELSLAIVSVTYRCFYLSCHRCLCMTTLLFKSVNLPEKLLWNKHI